MTNEFQLRYVISVEESLKELISDPSKKIVAKAVLNALKKMKQNLRHPSLNTHKYDDLVGPDGEDIFESYAQNNTPGAYRIFWYYGPGKQVLTILKICPHP